MSVLTTIKELQIDADIRYILFKRYLQIVALLSSIFTIVHLINKRPLSNILIAAFVALFCIGLYILSNYFNHYRLARLIFMFVITFIYVPFGYITSPGSQSAMVYILLLVLFILSFMATNKLEYIFPIMIVIESIILLRTEIWMPDNYYIYTDASYRIVDLSINFSVVAVSMILTIYYVMREFYRHNDKLYRLSITDSLTGLYNRRYFTDFVQTEYNRSVRTGEPFSLVFIDLNNFKRINDNYGHQKGDAVLKDIAEIIINNIRNYDIAARYGGDEFIIILPGTDSLKARAHIERMNDAFIDYSRQYSDTSFSVGFGVGDSIDKSLDEIYKLADDQLYKKKAEQKS